MEGLLFTHLSLPSYSWDIDKQDSPRCDIAVSSEAILFVKENIHRKIE